MKIVAFAGSSSKESINKKLVTYVAEQFPNVEKEILDLNDYEMPIFSVDREKHEGIPTLALEFAEKIDSADLLLIALAEHNSSYTAAFKNIFDWISRIKDRKHLGGKNVFLLATAPGPAGGRHVVGAFEARAPYSGAEIIQTFVLPKYGENFDEKQGITNAELKKEFEEKLEIIKKEYFY